MAILCQPDLPSTKCGAAGGAGGIYGAWMVRTSFAPHSGDTSTDFGTIPNVDDRFIEVDENSEPATMKSNRMLWSAPYTTVARDAVNPLFSVSLKATPLLAYAWIACAAAHAHAISASVSLTVPERRVHNPHLLHSSRPFGGITSGRAKRETYFSAEQPPPAQDSRVPGQDEHQERPERPQAPPRQGSQTIDRLSAGQRFRPQDRIRKRSEYQAIYDKGQKISSGSFVLFVMSNDQGRPRLGITVTRRIGGAVRRNRAKRLLREIFRRHKAEWTNVDIVVNGRAGLPDAVYARLEQEFLTRLRPFRAPR